MEAIHMLGIMEHIIQAITAVDIEKSEVWSWWKKKIIVLTVERNL
jgi:hypothetical protein